MFTKRFISTFSEYGVTTKFVDPDEENAFENAIDENTKAVFIESLGNPDVYKRQLVL